MNPQMISLSDVMRPAGKQRQKTYQKPLRCKVLKIGQEIAYSNAKGDAKLWNVVLADQSVALKAVVYDSDFLSNLTEGNNYIFRNYTVKPQPQYNTYVSFGKHTKVSDAPYIDIPKEVLATGETLLQQANAQDMLIKQVKRSPKKTKVSVKGRIVQDQEPTTVEVEGETVPIKRIHVKDNTDTIEVTLWRKLSSSPVKTGDYVHVTNASVGMMDNEKNLSTTQLSAIDVLQQPPKLTKAIIQAIDHSESGLGLSMLCQTENEFMSYIFTDDILKDLFHSNNNDDILQHLPKEVEFTEKDGRVLQITGKLDVQQATTPLVPVHNVAGSSKDKD